MLKMAPCNNIQAIDFTNRCDNFPVSSSDPTIVTQDYTVNPSLNYPSRNAYPIPNTCAGAIPTAQGVRKNIVGNMEGATDEWIDIPYLDVYIQNCDFIGSDGVKYEPRCCTDSGCSILGTQIIAQRIAYKGDQLNCCVLDKDYTNDAGSCWARPTPDGRSFNPDPLRSGTCSPQFRNINGGWCTSEDPNTKSVFNYCMGTDLQSDDRELLYRWFEGPKTCSYYANRRLYPNYPLFQKGQDIQELSSNINSVGFQQTRTMVDNLLSRYEKMGFQLGAVPGNNKYSKYQDNFRSICSAYPGLCEQVLTRNCAAFTLEQLALQPGLIDWCGCYLSDDAYQKYVSQFQVNRECTPLCNRISSIKYPTENGLASRPCNQDLCIIDDIALTLVNTTVEGSITFGQVCGNCTGGCRCIFEDSDINIVNSKVGGNINFSQNCSGGVPQCRIVQEDGTSRLVPCDSAGTVDPLAQYNYLNEAQKITAQKEQTTSIWTIILLVIIGILIFALIVWLITRARNDSKRSIVPRLDIPDLPVVATSSSSSSRSSFLPYTQYELTRIN